MSARRVADHSFSLPDNPTYIDFPRSDGSPNTWPATTTRILDSGGHVNYYAHVDLDHNQSQKWRASVGDAISLKLQMPNGPSYVLREFPQGYRLFDHHKGPANAPRHDLYLYGPHKKKFRSINEFIPHAIWLMGDSSSECECKYCAKSKKSQREITASLSNILRVTPTSSPGPSRVKNAREKGKGRDPARAKEVRQRNTSIYAAVQKVVEPLKASANVLKQPMLVERSNDLRGIFSKASFHSPRWFREAELVWCALDEPIRSEEGVTIEYWPAVIDEVILKSNSIPRIFGTFANGPSSSSAPHASSSTLVNPTVSEGERGPMLDPTAEPLPWKIQQTLRYKVQLLGVTHTTTVDNDNVLPYQAHLPPNEVLQLLANFPVENLAFDKTLLAKFNPYPPSDQPASIYDAIPSYAVGLQVASSLSAYWCLTDDYELKYTIPASPKPRVQTTVPPTSVSSHQTSTPQGESRTLQEVIELASRNNAFHTHSKSTHENKSAVNLESSNISTKTPAFQTPSSAPEKLSQTRFQGLWWGAERIWVDDFIRLKIPRRTLAPSGGDHILAAAGPGQASLQEWLGSSRDTIELGAGMRGVFLRLDSIIAVDVPSEHGYTKEARACGMLYELADEDYVEPNIPATSSSSTKLSQSALPQVKVSDGAAQNTNLPTSGPPMAMRLPPAPVGYKFRPILEPGYEFVGAMGLISGRYYPRILTHPRVKPVVHRALEKATNIEDTNNLWALEGLSGGYFNSVDPYRYKKSRLLMFQDADKEALTELQNYKQHRLAEQQAHRVTNLDQDNADEMDVDDIY